MGDLRLSDVYRNIGPTAYGTGLLILCVFVGMSEGFDVQAMAMAAPLVSREWGLAPGTVGILLAASVIGQVAGSFLLSPLGDKWGRRPAILAALLVAAIATFAGGTATDYRFLLLTRFVAGFALGLALSNTLAISMELVPARWRTYAVVLVSCGYPLGAAIGGAIVSRTLVSHGFASIFYVGGVGTFVALILCFLLLPESPVILARRANTSAKLNQLLTRLGARLAPDDQVVSDEHPLVRSRVAELLVPQRRTATLLLWLLNFANLSLVYFFIMWLPSLFVSRGLLAQDAVAASSLFSACGIVGGLLLAALMSRVGPIATLGGCYAVTVVAVLAFSRLTSADGVFFTVLAVCGAMIIGSQFCLSAVVNQFYPGEIRATGGGYALGAGRLGAVFAPLVGGVVLARVDSTATAFAVGAVPAAISLLGILLLSRTSLAKTMAENKG